MNDNDISRIIPDWTLSYVLGESDTEKVYQLEKGSDINVKHSLLRAVYIPHRDDCGNIKSDLEAEAETREYVAKMLNKQKREFAVLRAMCEKGAWLNLRECYDITNVNGTEALCVARFDNAQPLSTFIDENGFSQGAVLKMGIDLCRAVEKLKKDGRFHGTLKPDKIFVDEKCRFRVGKIDPDVYESGRLYDFSTEALAFAAPYVAEKGISYASEAYSVGMIMYYLLNDRRLPFEGDMTREEAIKLRLSGEGQTIPKPSHDIERITDIVLKACSYNPENGYETTYQMRKDLEEAYVRLEKEIQEKKLKEKALNKSKENKKSDISAFREHKEDDREKKEKSKKSKTKAVLFIAAVALLAFAAVFGPKLWQKITYRDLSKFKIELASVYYKNTEYAQEYAFDYSYDGLPKEPEIVIEKHENLVEGKDYNITYSDNTEIGKATVTVTGTGEYKGTSTRTFNIKPKTPGDIEEFTATEITSGSALLSWSKSENANRYLIYVFREDKNDWSSREFELDASVQSMTLTGLEPDRKYSYNIRGIYVQQNGDEEKGKTTLVEFKTKSE